MEIFNPYFYAADINLFAYEHAWTQYQNHGEKNFNVLSKDIYDSWDRCKRTGMDPRSETPPRRISSKALQQHLHQNQFLMDIATPYMTDLLEIIDNPGFSVLLSDQDCIILQSMSGNTDQEQHEQSPVLPGTDFSERVLGTNSIDLVNRLKKPVQLTYCQHYRSILHRESCSSAPICDTEENVIGVLSVIGRYEEVNEHTLGMVFAVAKAIEKQIGIFHINNKLQRQSDQLNTILSMIPNGIMYLEDSRVIHINQAMLRMIGKEERQCVGKPVHDILQMNPPLLLYWSPPPGLKTKMFSCTVLDMFSVASSRARIYAQQKIKHTGRCFSSSGTKISRKWQKRLNLLHVIPFQTSSELPAKSVPHWIWQKKQLILTVA